MAGRDEAEILAMAEVVIDLTISPDANAHEWERQVGECFDWMWDGNGVGDQTAEEIAAEWLAYLQPRAAPDEDD